MSCTGVASNDILAQWFTSHHVAYVARRRDFVFMRDMSLKPADCFVVEAHAILTFSLLRRHFLAFLSLAFFKFNISTLLAYLRVSTSVFYIYNNDTFTVLSCHI